MMIIRWVRVLQIECRRRQGGKPLRKRKPFAPRERIWMRRVGRRRMNPGLTRTRKVTEMEWLWAYYFQGMTSHSNSWKERKGTKVTADYYYPNATSNSRLGGKKALVPKAGAMKNGNCQWLNRYLGSVRSSIGLDYHFGIMDINFFFPYLSQRVVSA